MQQLSLFLLNSFHVFWSVSLVTCMSLYYTSNGIFFWISCDVCRSHIYPNIWWGYLRPHWLFCQHTWNVSNSNQTLRSLLYYKPRSNCVGNWKVECRMKMKWDKFPPEAVHIGHPKGMNADIVHKVCFYKKPGISKYLSWQCFVLKSHNEYSVIFPFSSVRLIVWTNKWWDFETSAKSFFDTLKHLFHFSFGRAVRVIPCHYKHTKSSDSFKYLFKFELL